MGKPNRKDIYNFCRYAIFDCSIFLLSQNRYVFRFAQTRYDINLVASATYRVIYDISKISTEIYIDEKETDFFVEICLFFWRSRWDKYCKQSFLLVHPNSASFGTGLCNFWLKNLPPATFFKRQKPS